jgi:LacI family transcriptional regulator
MRTVIVMKEKVERVRIVDIAEELGLSTATVSNVIHGKTKKISDETVKRVQQLLEERKYIPSMAGMLLAQNNSKIVGVLINNHSKYEKRVLQDPFISSAIDYLSEEIEKRGCFMMVKCMGNTEDIIRFASMWNMEGLIMIGFCDQDYEKLRDGMHIPFVVYDGFFNEINRYANISVDNQKGGYLAGKYLIEKGHSSIMYLADNQICMDLERFHGLIKAMLEAGMDTPKEMFHLIPLTEAKRQEYYLEHLADFHHYTAAFAASDVYAIELMNFLKDHGIRVPEDISVMGFDDIPECNIVRPKLTTIHQDSRRRAEMAIQMLMDLRERKEITMNQVLPVHLVERMSVK